MWLIQTSLYNIQNDCVSPKYTMQNIVAIVLYLSYPTYQAYCDKIQAPIIREALPGKKWVAQWQNQYNDCAPNEDSDQPGHSPCLIRVFTVCSFWVAKDPSFRHADSEDSDQTGRMPRLIWVFVDRTVVLLVLSWGVSNEDCSIAALILAWRQCLRAADL